MWTILSENFSLKRGRKYDGEPLNNGLFQSCLNSDGAELKEKKKFITGNLKSERLLMDEEKEGGI